MKRGYGYCKPQLPILACTAGQSIHRLNSSEEYTFDVQDIFTGCVARITLLPSPLHGTSGRFVLVVL